MSDVASEGRFADTTTRARLFDTPAGGSLLLVRLLVGLVVFVPEGVQKLLFPEILGAGRFAHIGIPYPMLWDPLSAGSKSCAVRSHYGLAHPLLRCR